MSKTRKFVVALMTFFLAVLAAIGVLSLNVRAAEGDTEINWPTTFTAADWDSETQLRMPTGFVSKNQADLKPTAEMLAKVKITRGTATYACSNIYEWNGCLTFYFTNSYTGKTAPQTGDVLSVDAGFSVVQNGTTYISSEAVSWTYTGSLWLMDGAELPDEPIAVTVSGVASVATPFPSFPIRLDVATNGIGLGGGATNLNYTTGTDAYVTYTRGDYSVKAGAFHAENSTIRVYFKGSADLVLEQDKPVRGDIFTLGKGFAFKSADGSAEYAVNEDIKYIYTGSSWIAGTTLPTEVTVSDVTNVATPYPNFPIRLDVATNGIGLGGGATNLNYTTGTDAYVTYTRGEYSVKAGAFHAENGTIRVYFKGSADLVLEQDKPVEGDIFTLGKGFAFTSADKSVNYLVTEDLVYTYNGTAWVAEGGTEEPDPEPVETTPANVNSVTTNSMGNNSYPIVISANTDVAVSLGGNADLHADAAELKKVTYTRGDFTLTANLVRGYGQAILGWFKSTSDVAFTVNTPVRGDIFRIAENFTFRSGDDSVTYCLTAPVEYIYDGTAWIEGTELPDAPVAVTVSGVTSVDTPFDAFPIRVDVKTNASGLGSGGDLKYTAGTQGYVAYARDGKSVAAGAFHADGGTIRAYFKASQDVALVKDTPVKGDIFTLGTGFSFTSADGSVKYSVNEDFSYIYTGFDWIAGTELPAEAEITGVESLATQFPAYPMNVVVATTGANLGTSGNLSYAQGAAANVTYTRNGVTVSSGVLHARENTKFVAFFANASGLTFANAENQAGDILTVKAGFAFSSKDDVSYMVYETVSYVYTAAGTWVEYIPATGMEIAESNLTVEAEKTVQIQVSLTPVESTEAVIYQSLSPEIATVDKNGLVLGVKEGTAEIVVKAGNFTKSVFVTVEPATVEYVKTGIRVTENGEQIIYSGRDYVKPTVAYVYTPEKDVTEYVPAESVIVDEGNFDNMTAGDYTLKVKVLKDGSTTEYFETTFKVTVKASTPLTIESMTTTDSINADTDSTFFVNTDSDNTAKNDAEGSDAMLAILPYVEFYFPDGTKGNVWACRLNGSVVRFFIKKQSGSGNINSGEIPAGSVFTIKAGFGITEDEYLAEEVSYVFNGTEFESLVEPEDFEISVPKLKMYVGTVMQISVTADESVNVIYQYYSASPETGTVDTAGRITATATGTLVIRVSWRDLTKQIEIEVVEAPADRTFEIVSPISEFWVPVSTTENPTSFTLQGYTLEYHYVYDDGSETPEKAVTEAQIGELDYTKPGNYDLIISDPESEQTDSVTVIVYEYKEVKTFDSVTISGYDINDNRNGPNTWNGHMYVSMKSYSSNSVNLLSQSELNTMASYIEYTTADGKTYPSKNEDGSVKSSIGLWTVGTNLLVMIRPEGATGNVGYGTAETWKEEYPTDPAKPSYKWYPYSPIYKLGDKITFKKGMPIYAWKGNKTENNRPQDGEGYMIIEGYLADDYTYYCREEDGTNSIWTYYKEYTDFTVPETMTLSAGGTAVIGAVRVPSDATTGTFSYVSSDENIVTVTEQGYLVGMGVGTAEITVTLSGGVDENGDLKDPIVKKITVTVERNITLVAGEIKVTQGAKFDPSKYEITVTFSDGTTENISLNDERVALQTIDTSKLGTTEYNISVTIDGQTKRGTLKVTVEAKKGCGGGCKSSLAGTMAVVTAISAVAVVFAKKKKRG